MRVLPPSRGGRTVGDAGTGRLAEKCQISQMCEYSSSPGRAGASAQRFGAAEFRLENDLRRQAFHKAALARNAELFRKGALYVRNGAQRAFFHRYHPIVMKIIEKHV